MPTRTTTSARYIADLIENTDWKDRGFLYFDGNQIKEPSEEALRDDLADNLWKDSAALLDLGDGCDAMGPLGMMGDHRGQDRERDEDALEVARRRYKAGELTDEEFDAKRRRIEGR